MGRQIGFFMIGNDEQKFLKIVEDQEDLIVNIKNQPMNLNELKKPLIFTNDESAPPPILSFFIISNQSTIILDKNGFINDLRSDVIKFSRCSIINNNTVREGRIWAEFYYYNDKGDTIKKEKWFEQKFNTYRSWIKKNLRISVDKDSYIGDEAYKLNKEKGYRMMGGPKVEIKF